VFVISAKGVDGKACIGEMGADSGPDIPMLLKISSFGEVAISLSKGVISTTGASFGTIRRMVPSGIFISFDSLHLFCLLGWFAVGGFAKAMLILAIASVCVASVGVSAPRRLKMERLRRLRLFEDECRAVGELPVSRSEAMIAVSIDSLRSALELGDDAYEQGCVQWSREKFKTVREIET
jgi:hypothetical protein